MKCEKCNADLSIDHANCPYCGTPNPYYQLHRQEMHQYEQEFTKTKQDVYNETKRFTGWTVRVTVITVLVALNLLFFLGHTAFADTIIYEKQCSRLERQADEIRERLEEMERQGDYIGFAEFCSSHSMWRVEALDDFSQVWRVCENYQYIYDSVMSLHDGQGSNRVPNIEVQVDIIQSALHDIYQAMDPEQSYACEAAYEGLHKETMEQCLEQAYVLLYTYGNISKDDLEQFPEMSAAQRSMILEEGLRAYEKDE